MKLIYIILAHTGCQQLIRLIERIRDPNNTIFIHIDKKTPSSLFSDLSQYVNKLPDCCMTARHRVFYGQAQTASFEMLAEIHQTIPNYDFIILLSGQDYPLKSQSQIHEYLAGFHNKQFMEYYPLPAPGWGLDGGMDRFQKYHFYLFSKHICYPPYNKHGIIRPFLHTLYTIYPGEERSLPNNYLPYGGSAWWCFSKNAVDYLCEFMKTNTGKQLYHFFKYVRMADEMFYQTILMNSPLQDTIINDILHQITFPIGHTRPRTYTSQDYETLMNSNKCFARKFDTAIDENILNELDKTIDAVQNKTATLLSKKSAGE